MEIPLSYKEIILELGKVSRTNPNLVVAIISKNKNLCADNLYNLIKLKNIECIITEENYLDIFKKIGVDYLGLRQKYHLNGVYEINANSIKFID